MTVAGGGFDLPLLLYFLDPALRSATETKKRMIRHAAMMVLLFIDFLHKILPISIRQPDRSHNRDVCHDGCEAMIKKFQGSLISIIKYLADDLLEVVGGLVYAHGHIHDVPPFRLMTTMQIRPVKSNPPALGIETGTEGSTLDLGRGKLETLGG